jgi:hypothetical protein
MVSNDMEYMVLAAGIVKTKKQDPAAPVVLV